MRSEVQTRQPSALLVLWQQPATRAMIPVAELSFDGAEYRFTYLPTVDTVPGFRPLLGFKDFSKTYVSDELFPLFRERVLDPTRPDFDRVVHELDLDLADATPWELLMRTGGGSEGDTLQVTPFPRPDGDGWACTFLASGVRYFREKSVRTAHRTTDVYSDEEFEVIIGSLEQGEALSIEREVGNSYNQDARVLVTAAGHAVGYLPDWLARFTAPYLQDGTEFHANVVRVNDARAGWHLRLMVAAYASESFVEAAARLRVGGSLDYRTKAQPVSVE